MIVKNSCLKVFQEVVGIGNKLKDDPKCPVFLGVEVKRASDLWDETNKLALDRLSRLRGDRTSFLPFTHNKFANFLLFSDNLSAWERYENKRNELGNASKKKF